MQDPAYEPPVLGDEDVRGVRKKRPRGDRTSPGARPTVKGDALWTREGYQLRLRLLSDVPGPLDRDHAVYLPKYLEGLDFSKIQA